MGGRKETEANEPSKQDQIRSEHRSRRLEKQLQGLEGTEGRVSESSGPSWPDSSRNPTESTRSWSLFFAAKVNLTSVPSSADERSRERRHTGWCWTHVVVAAGNFVELEFKVPDESSQDTPDQGTRTGGLVSLARRFYLGEQLTCSPTHRQWVPTPSGS